MRKIFCDRCRRESNEGVHIISVPCHIVESSNGYINRDGYAVSGRLVNYDLCHKCSNEIYAVVFLMIQDKKVEESAAVTLGRKGGKARAAKLTENE